MSDHQLDDWLRAAGFIDVAVDGPVDDPWSDLDVAISPLSDDQRAYLAGGLDPFDDERVVDEAAWSAADSAVIEFPADPDDVEPF